MGRAGFIFNTFCEDISLYELKIFIVKEYMFAVLFKSKKLIIASFKTKFLKKQLRTQSNGCRKDKIIFAFGKILRIVLE